ncbi:hypothetical protein FAUST_1399 [Fusarium austroamericanum]|uniref:Amino acid permease n=1 Tax=Fusarium austroamericanum TaxID=282268 RepID=A0AAN6C8N6_FUSAU|nr:hypothetical protein FAUST_1399 [Fusarium austroamericanum]
MSPPIEPQVDAKMGIEFDGPEKHHNAADQMLENLGYTAELSRNRSTAQVAFMSFVLASIPCGLASTMFYPLNGGGPVDVVWGWVAVSLIIICVALSLGEITSLYPTAGGVYYQAFMLSPPFCRRAMGWFCGWMYLVGNITITLSVNFVAAQFFVASINVFEDKSGAVPLEGNAWQVYLIFLAITILTNFVSSCGNKWLPTIDAAAIFWTFAGMMALAITVLVLAKEGRRDANYVFTHFEVSSGWPGGWSFCVGLLQAAYSTSSTGMIISMCEEVQNPSIQVPRAMVATVLINTVAGLLFLVPLMFVLPDLQQVLAVASGQPVPMIIKSAVGSAGGAFGLLIPLCVLLIICGIGCTTATSRCVFAFARDGAIPGAKWWTKINRPLGNVPFNAMMLSMVVQLALGLIYFGNATAFNAFSGVGVICLTIAYTVPIAMSLWNGRKQVKEGNFYLGYLGLAANIIAIGWCLLAVPLFCMPASIPVTAVTVNYAPVVFVFSILISGAWYLMWGHRNYAGPPVTSE